jgi:hypothetical protein
VLREMQIEAMQEVKRTVIEEVTQARMIAMPKQQPTIVTDIPPDKHQQNALQALHGNPTISNTELAKVLQVKDARTAKSWRQRQEA